MFLKLSQKYYSVVKNTQIKCYSRSLYSGCAISQPADHPGIQAAERVLQPSYQHQRSAPGRSPGQGHIH